MIKERRGWQHVFESRSEAQLKDVFGSVGWVVERISEDYGEDLYGRPFENGNPTGNDFFIQLKGTDDVSQYKLKTKEYFSYKISLENLRQWHRFYVPVILVIWDISKRTGYWVHVQPIIRSKLESKSNWLENKPNSKEPKRKIHIPCSNVLSEGNIESLDVLIQKECGRIREAKNLFDAVSGGYKGAPSEIESKDLPENIRDQLLATKLAARAASKPDDLTSWLDLAATHYKIGNHAEALKSINHAWKIDKEDTNTMQVRACILAEYSRASPNSSILTHEAIELFKTLNNNNAQALREYNIGNCYSILNDHENARLHFNNALTLNPSKKDAAQIWTNLGNTLADLGKKTKAIEAFEKAISLDPNLWNAYASWASVEVNNRNFEEANKLFSEAFLYGENLLEVDSNLVYWYARTYQEIGNSHESLKLINELLSSDPLHQEAHDLKAYLYNQILEFEDEHDDEAIDYLSNRLRANDQDWTARTILTNIYAKKELEDQFMNLLKDAIDLNDCPTSFHFRYSSILEEQEQFGLALECLGKIPVKDHDHFFLHTKARIHRKNGDFKEAINFYQLALKDVSNPIPILTHIADCYNHLGDYEQCVLVLTRGIVEDGGSFEFKRNLRFALLQLGVDYDKFNNYIRPMAYDGVVAPDNELLLKIKELKNS